MLLLVLVSHFFKLEEIFLNLDILYLILIRALYLLWITRHFVSSIIYYVKLKASSANDYSMASWMGRIVVNHMSVMLTK